MATKRYMEIHGNLRNYVNSQAASDTGVEVLRDNVLSEEQKEELSGYWPLLEAVKECCTLLEDPTAPTGV